MNRTKRATWMVLLLSTLGGVMGQACSNEEENSDRNGEAEALKGGCQPAADDGDPCTLEGCEGMPNAHVPTAGLPCGKDGALSCNAAGQCVGCASPDQCGAYSECAPWKCETSVCTKVSAPAGTPLMTQMVGDCKEEQCDGNGSTMTVNDDNDAPSKQCQNTTCVNGVPMSMPSAQGTPCTVGNGKSCDGMGNCVECITDADCGQDPNVHCATTTKTCYACNDGVQNGDESDVDCGGDKCNKCAQGLKCNSLKDCQGAFQCADGVCCNSICDTACKACNIPGTVGICDNVPQYGEDASFGNGQSCLSANNEACTGGGGCALTNGQPCVANGDCASNRCGDPDGNGTKTCVKNVGEACTMPSECFTNICTNNVCSN